MIPAAELESMQAVLAQTRTQYVNVLRLVTFPDGAGGTIQSWEPSALDVLARLSPQGMQPWEKIDRVEGRVVTTSVWLIWLPADTDVRSDDRIDAGDAGVFEVTAASVRAVALEQKVQAVLIQ